MTFDTFYSGEDFHATIKHPFVFKDESVGCRHSKKTKVVKLPPFVPPRCTFTVRANANKMTEFNIMFERKF